MVKAIAIIPARSGSKRIPNKNVVEFDGCPLIASTIQAAIESECFDHVIVSTNSEEYAKIAQKFGAEVPFLRENACDDYSPVSEATVSALDQAETFYRQNYDLVVQLMANCPLRSAVTIKKCLNAFDETSPCSLISCFKFGWMNPWWAYKVGEGNNPVPIFPDYVTNRSQDLPELFCPTGAIWISDAKLLKKTKNFYSPGWKFFEIPFIEAIDIDTYEDLKIALYFKKYRDSSG